jgi:hypothetical protein
MSLLLVKVASCTSQPVAFSQGHQSPSIKLAKEIDTG